MYHTADCALAEQMLDGQKNKKICKPEESDLSYIV